MSDFDEFRKKEQAKLISERDEQQRLEQKQGNDHLKLKDMLKAEWPALF